jgi:hypothetical protein
MASNKRSSKVSRISRDRTVAYARRKKPAPEGGDGGDGDDTDDDAARAPDDSTAAPAAAAPTEKIATAEKTDAPVEKPVEQPAPVPDAEASAETSAPPLLASVQPWPDATPVPMPPVRARTDTVTMPAQASIGAPPAMPKDTAPIPAPVQVDAAENPTRMPGPREIPGGNPDDPASPPGSVPAGDSRSMRRRTDRYEFVLVYRIQTYVITRFGVVGTRGQWRVVEYPTPASASHAYAKECSRFVSDGFSDYRE